MEIWKHFSGYGDAREKVKHQGTEDDLKLLDDLFGRDRLAFGATPEEIKIARPFGRRKIMAKEIIVSAFILFAVLAGLLWRLGLIG